MKFLGETPDSDLPLIIEKLNLACEGIKSLALRIEGTGVFPNANRPRAYWAGIKAESSLFTIQKNIEQEMQALGFEPDENKFTPHLTVARIKEPIGKQRMTAALLNYKIASEPVIISEILIMRSHLKAEGARYEAVGRATLEG